MTVDELKSQTRKDLAGMAKTRGVAGWHAMRKDELVKALSRLARKDRRKNGSTRRSSSLNGKRVRSAATNGSSTNGNSPNVRMNGAKTSNPKNKSGSNGNGRHNHQRPLTAGISKNLASENGADAALQDRLFVVAHDAFWLHALWELCPATIQRAEAGLAHEWHTAQPVIRVLDVSADENRRCVEKTVKDVAIHGGINHWYIEVANPPGVYQLQIGYLAASGRFFGMARSNVVTTPEPGACGIVDENWSKTAQQYENGHSQNGKRNGDSRIREMIDQQMRRPMSSHPLTDFLPTGARGGDDDGIDLDMGVELVVFGNATPGARLTISEENVDLREDGSFTIRLSMPEGRQVVPATITSSSGVKQQTVVLAVERNTKHLEARHFDGTEM